jgi:hypothetical protein
VHVAAATAPVTASTTNVGFFHFGRFAAEYRTLYGEAPFRTLRGISV